MAGHSKWNNIKHRKEAADARRGKLFSKMAKLIMVAAKSGGGNPNENLNLRYAIERARAWAEVGATRIVHGSRYADAAEFARAAETLGKVIRPALS